MNLREYYLSSISTVPKIVIGIALISLPIIFTAIGEYCYKNKMAAKADSIPYDLAIINSKKAVNDTEEYPRLTDQNPLTPIEKNAILDEQSPQYIVGLESIAWDIRKRNMICDSVSGIHINLAKEGLQVACNHFGYKYNLVDQGGDNGFTFNRVE